MKLTNEQRRKILNSRRRPLRVLARELGIPAHTLAKIRKEMILDERRIDLIFHRMTMGERQDG